jgi:hypothetical protein
VKAWIGELGRPTQAEQAGAIAYLDFTGRPPLESLEARADSRTSYSTTRCSRASPHCANVRNFFPLWFASLFESLPSVPVRAADTFGSALIRVLRVQTGFESEGIGFAGMDEVRRTEYGQAIDVFELEIIMYRGAGLPELKVMREAVEFGCQDVRAFAEWMAHMNMRWLEERDLLVGLVWGFMEVHEKIATEDTLLDEEAQKTLGSIAKRERDGFGICRRKMESDARRDKEFQRDIAILRTAVGVYCAN